MLFIVLGPLKILTASFTCLAKILGLCKTAKDNKRLAGSLLNTNIQPPSLYLVMKDHKSVPVGQSIPGRPICGATSSHNGQLSHILSIIINAMAEHYDIGSESDSTGRYGG